MDGIDHVAGGAGDDPLHAFGSAGDDSIQVLGLLANTRVLFGFSGSAETTGFETVDADPFTGTDVVTARPQRDGDQGRPRPAEHLGPARRHRHRHRHAGRRLDQAGHERHDADRRRPYAVQVLEPAPERGEKI